MSVDRRDEKRARPVARAHLIQVRAHVEQRLHRFPVTFARRQEHRRETALGGDQLVELVTPIDTGHLLRSCASTAGRRTTAAARRRLSGRRRIPRRERAKRLFVATERREVGDLRGRPQIRSAPGEQVEHGRTVGRRGKHRGGQSADRLLRVDVRAAVNQECHGVRAAGRSRKHQRGGAVRRLRVHVGARFQQRLHYGRAAVLRGEDQRRIGADTRRRPDAGPGIQQRLRELRIVVHRRPVERGHAIALRGVHVGRLFEEQPHRVLVALHRRIGNRSGRRGIEQRGQHRRAQHGQSKPSHHDRLATRIPNPNAFQIPNSKFQITCSDRAPPCCRRSLPPLRSRACAPR